MGSLIALAILKCWFGGGGVDEYGGEGGEASGGISGDGNYGMCYLIKLNTLLGETQAHSSSLSREGEIRGLLPKSSIP